MPQTRQPYQDVDDAEVAPNAPVKTSLVTRLRDQWFSALCDAGSVAGGVNRLSLPLRAKTTETDVNKVLRPDGAGGVLWGNLTLPYSGGCNHGLQFVGGGWRFVFPLGSNGVWVVNAHGASPNGSPNPINATASHGMCLVTKNGNSITYAQQSTVAWSAGFDNGGNPILFDVLSCALWGNNGAGALTWTPSVIGIQSSQASYTAVRIG